jgi:thiol-disulfide isomerase/thioredoxin
MRENWKSIAFLVLLLAVLAGWYWYKLPKFVVGEQAPDFSFQSLTGQTVRLSEFRGKYVLLHFWGSWCGPCRRENPDILSAYGKYHAAAFRDGYGFEVVSIGMETSPEAWRKAIQKDGLLWVNHYTDLQNLNGLIAKQYRVTEIPTTYLLNPEGKIIAVNPTHDALEKALEDRLNR